MSEGGKQKYESLGEYIRSYHFVLAILVFTIAFILWYIAGIQGINLIIFMGIIGLLAGLISFENKWKAVILMVGVIAIFGTLTLATGLSLDISAPELPSFIDGMTALRTVYIPVVGEISFALSGQTSGIFVWVDLVKILVPFFIIVAGAIFAMDSNWTGTISCVIACVIIVLMNTILGAGGISGLTLAEMENTNNVMGVLKIPDPMLSAVATAFPSYVGNGYAIGFIALGYYLLALMPFFILVVGVWFWKIKK